jgi:hypothetical protein
MTDLPYASAKAGQGREREIRATLRTLGASAIGFMVDDDRALIICQFRLGAREITIPISVADYAHAWLAANPHSTQRRSTLEQHRQKARAQAEIACWAVLADWTKAQATMIRCGLMSADVAFLPHIHGPDGKRVAEALAGPDGALRLTKGGNA